MVFACRCCSELYEAEVAQGTSLRMGYCNGNSIIHKKVKVRKAMRSTLVDLLKNIKEVAGYD